MSLQQFTEADMANFIDTNINQTVFLDINFLDQLGTDNFISICICSGLIAPDILIRDNICQLLRCHYESKANVQTVP